MPGREPDSRHGLLAPDRLGEAVVAAAGAQRRLCPQGVGLQFENGPRVVVEAADEERVLDVGDAEAVEERLDLGVMLGGRPAHEVGEARGVGQERLLGRVLRVEDAERVGLEPLAAGLGEVGGVRREVVAERVAVARAVGGVAQRVEAEPRARDAERVVDGPERGDGLGVGAGVVAPDELGSELVELAEPPRCGRSARKQGPT